MPNENRISDGSFDFSYGVDSSRTPTIRSPANPNGLPRNGLSWLVNGSVRTGGINTRTGWQLLATVHPGDQLYQGGWMYEPDFANPYLVLGIGGRYYRVRVDTDNSVDDITGISANANPPDIPISHFCQGEQFLVIQSGDFIEDALFWDGATMRRSLGLAGKELPPAGPMTYYMQRLWYAIGRSYSAGDIVKGPSGTAPYQNRDSILKVTENPLAINGDGFSVPTNAGNIRALGYPIALDQTLGEGPLFIFTPKQIYSESVPVTRSDWIAADTNNMPLQRVVMNYNGSVGDRCIAAWNGDLYYQSREPAIRSFNMSLRYFGQFGNKAISNNIIRALQFNNRALMRTASGIVHNNLLYQTILPRQSNVGVVFDQIAILDLDPVSTLKEDQLPAWNGAYEGLAVLGLFEGDFGGLHRAFAVAQSAKDGSIGVWELTDFLRFDGDDHRITTLIEFPSFDWSIAGSGLSQGKELDGCDLFIDKMFGDIEFHMTYRTDQDPCEYKWAHWKECFARDSCELSPSPMCYPTEGFREGYAFPMSLPKPKAVCRKNQKLMANLGFQFQPILRIKGWCRVRGLQLHALPRELPAYYKMICQVPPKSVMDT